MYLPWSCPSWYPHPTLDYCLSLLPLCASTSFIRPSSLGHVALSTSWGSNSYPSCFVKLSLFLEWSSLDSSTIPLPTLSVALWPWASSQSCFEIRKRLPLFYVWVRGNVGWSPSLFKIPASPEFENLPLNHWKDHIRAASRHPDDSPGLFHKNPTVRKFWKTELHCSLMRMGIWYKKILGAQ